VHRVKFLPLNPLGYSPRAGGRGDIFMPTATIIPKTLEQLLKSWNPRLWIKEIDNPDVDSVMFGEQYVCAVPKGGKYKGWIQIMAEDKRKEGNATTDGIRHRSMSGLVLTLVRKKIIDWKANDAMFRDTISGQIVKSVNEKS